jgi:hypothetical protein
MCVCSCSVCIERERKKYVWRHGRSLISQSTGQWSWAGCVVEKATDQRDETNRKNRGLKNEEEEKDKQNKVTTFYSISLCVTEKTIAMDTPHPSITIYPLSIARQPTRSIGFGWPSNARYWAASRSSSSRTHSSNGEKGGGKGDFH